MLSALSINAESKYNSKDKVTDRLKAIVAFHVVHKKGGEFTANPLTESPADVNALKKLIKNNSNDFDELCKKIDDLEDDAKDKNGLINLFDQHLKNLGINDPNALKQIETVVNNSDYPFKDVIQDDEDENVRDKKSNSEENAPSVSPKVPPVVQNSPDEEQNGIIYHSNTRGEGSNGFPVLGIISVLLAIALLTLIYFFIQLKKDYDALEKKYKDVSTNIIDCADLTEINDKCRKDSLSDLVNHIKTEFKRKKMECNELKRQIAELEKSKDKSTVYHNVQNSVDDRSERSDTQTEKVSTDEVEVSTLEWVINPNESAHIQHDDVGKKDTLVGKKMYLNFPQDDVFDEGTEEYLQGKSLYCMTYTSEETAVFEFVNKPENIRFAQQSRSSFLEEACIIENDDVETFSYIQTTEKGELEKYADGWKIVSKARIRLS